MLLLAGHLIRTAHDPARALPLAKEAHERLGTARATLQYGSNLLYLEQFDEAIDLFTATAASASGTSRLIAVTQLVSAARRRAEWIATHDHNPLVAFVTVAKGMQPGLAMLRSGVRDRTLRETVVQAMSDGFLHAKSIENFSEESATLLADLVQEVGRNERYWERAKQGWGFCSHHRAALLARSDLPASVAAAAAIGDSQHSYVGLNERHDGSILRFFPTLGYGFLKGSGLEVLEIFFRAKDLNSRFDRLMCRAGTSVTFTLTKSSDRVAATEIDFATDERARVFSQDLTGVVRAKHDRFAFLLDDATHASVFLGPIGLTAGYTWRDLREGVKLHYKAELASKGVRVVRHTGRPEG